MPPVTYKYPYDIDANNRTHLNISAYEYTLPSVEDRARLGQTTGISQRAAVAAATNDAAAVLSDLFAPGAGLDDEELADLQSRASSISAAAAQALLEEKLENTGETEDPVSAILKEKLFTILTYIPSGIGDRVSATWSNEKIALVGDAKKISDGVVNSIREGGGFGTDTAAALKGAAESMVNPLVNSMLGGISKKVPGVDTIRQSFEASIGKRLAPSEALVFQGTSGIELPINITMAPRNSQEGRQMVQIIETLRNATIPELSDVIANLVYFFKYPPIFKITLVRGGSAVRTGSFFQYNAMALTGFSVSYAEGSSYYTYYDDDIPTKANLSLTFQSIFPIFRTGSILGD